MKELHQDIRVQQGAWESSICLVKGHLPSNELKTTKSAKGRQPTELEKTFPSDTSDKWLIFKIYREFRKLNTRKIRLQNGLRT